MKSIFDEIDALIDQLRTVDCEQLANILDHRLHRVAWTSGSELREELKKVLSESDCLNPVLAKKIKKIINKL